MTKLTSFLSICLFGCNWLLQSGAHAQSIQSLDQIVAVANDNVILQSELVRAMRNVRSQFAGHESELPPEPILEHQVIERLVLIKLQVERAELSGIHVSEDELNRAITSIAEQNHTSLDGLHAQLAHDGLSYSQFRQSVHDEIVIERLRQSFAMSHIVVSDNEVDAALAAATKQGVQYHLAHILIQLPEGAQAAQISAAQRKAEGIKKLIDSGQLEFSAAAMRYSESPNALDGGDLGYRSLQEIPSAFTQLIEELKPGQIVGPIRGPSGFQLLRLIDKRDRDTAAALTTETQYHARHILIRPTAALDSVAAKAKITELYARILHGTPFDVIARKQSNDEISRDRGGDLGWFTANAYGADFGRHVAALKNGELSQPFETESGWHLVQRLDVRQHPVQDAERRAQVRETIGQHKLEDAYNRFLLELRNESYVNIRLNSPQSNAENSSSQPAPSLPTSSP